jgi:hypothetical protein
MSTKLAKILADFRTSLATELPVAGTSATLQSATDDDGVALPAGAYLFTIDGRNSQKEYIACTLSGTTISNVFSVSRQGVQTSGAVRKHRIGASVVITDWAQLKYMSDLLEGATGFNASVPLSYDGNPTFTLDGHIISKKYADDLAIAGAPVGTHLVPGIFLKATTVETIAGTDTNGTYTYVIPVGLTKATTAGAADQGKVPLLDASGVLDQTFINSPRTWTQVQTLSADNLQVTSDPDSDNDVVRRSFVVNGFSTVSPNVGDGSDGAVTISAPTTLTRDMYYTTLVVDSGITLSAGNFRIFASTSITNNGTISVIGGNASGATGGTAVAAGSFTGGSNGGDGAVNNGNAGATINSYLGGQGGTGGSVPTRGAGAGGGGAAAAVVKPRTAPIAILAIEPGSTIRLFSGGAGGGGGGGDTATLAGGGGGAGGGNIFLASPIITNSVTGVISVAGGNGGNGQSIGFGAGGGGGGGGGSVITISKTYTNLGSVVLTGGTGGAPGSGGGSAGANGSAGNLYQITL